MKKKSLYRILSVVLFFMLMCSWTSLAVGLISLPAFFVVEYFTLQALSHNGLIGVGK